MIIRKYNSLNITLGMVIRFLASTWFTAYFGSDRLEGSYEDHGGCTAKQAAREAWHYCFAKDIGYDGNFLLDQVWYANAPAELQVARAEWEAVQSDMARYC